jgi:predicted nucleic acid-binding Zn ribbon protein
MPTHLCEYCGTKFSSVVNLTSSPCFRHPLGPNKGKHKLFEGGEKPLYVCKYCGTDNTGLANLTSMPCYRHPSGSNKGKHVPAL